MSIRMIDFGNEKNGEGGSGEGRPEGGGDVLEVQVPSIPILQPHSA